jgi:LAGLIDADG DNA endonuclease family
MVKGLYEAFDNSKNDNNSNFEQIKENELVVEDDEVKKRVSGKKDYVYQVGGMYVREDVVEYFVTTCPGPILDLICSDWYYMDPVEGFKKKMAANLNTYITAETLAFIYMNVGLEWVGTDTQIGLDLRKFDLDGIHALKSFISHKFRVRGYVAEATDSNYILIFPDV